MTVLSGAAGPGRLALELSRVSTNSDSSLPDVLADDLCEPMRQRSTAVHREMASVSIQPLVPTVGRTTVGTAKLRDEVNAGRGRHRPQRTVFGVE